MTTAAATAKKGHPKGLYLLFTTEMWERMSYYGMRALLVLYLVNATTGFGWSDASAYRLYGWYTGFVYLTPVIGGILADRYLGQRKAVMWGGVLMMLGQFALAGSAEGLWAFMGSPEAVLTARQVAFFTGLTLLIIGNGLFKPNISTMVGNLYKPGDSRRDGAFTIFYMGINLGAFFSPLVSGTLGESLGWHWGFVSAGVGMLFGIVTLWIFGDRFLGDVGSAPVRVKGADGHKKDEPLTREDYHRIAVIFILGLFVILFWAAFEQAGGLFNIFTDRKVDRMLGDWEVKTTWFQSLNPLFILVLGPLFAMLWRWLGQKGKDPNPAVKMAFGLMFAGVGFLLMVVAAKQAESAGMAAMWFIVVTYLIHTVGELMLSPVGLSMVTKLSPARLASMMMGVWFMSNFAANLLAGYIGGYAEAVGEVQLFTWIAMATIGGGVVLLLISPLLHAWMHGAADTRSEPTEPAPESQPEAAA